MKIQPLAITVPSWPELDAFVTKATNNSPIRFLDNAKLSPGNLHAYLLSLEFFISQGQNPITNIAQCDCSLDHVFLTIGIESDDHERDAFMDLDLKKSVICKPSRGREYQWYILMSGTLLEWRNSTIRYLSRNQSFEKRAIFYEMYCWFKSANLSGLFGQHRLIQFNGDSFYLEIK